MRFLKQFRLPLLAVLPLILMAYATGRTCAAQNDGKALPPSPDLQVDYVGAEKGYAAGTGSVTVLCVIRNAGGGALPENAARVRCYPLTGMDFMSGQLWPTLPGLAPGQAAAFRWRLSVSDETTPLLFSVLISRAERNAETEVRPIGGPRMGSAEAEPNITPRVASALIPRFSASPHLLGGAIAKGKAPAATGGRGTARVGNDRALVHVVAAQGQVPVLVLGAWDGSDWRPVALGTPVLQVRSAEEGQIPWVESFRWRETQVENGKDIATLTLIGNVGANWTAYVTLESRTDTGVISGKARLVARRNVRLYGLQLPRLLSERTPGGAPPKADGSATLLSSEPSPIASQERLAASHSGSLTFGLSWPAQPPLTGWSSARLAEGDSERLQVLGGDWTGDSKGDVILAGASVDIPFRLFVLGSSSTVRDALRFVQP